MQSFLAALVFLTIIPVPTNRQSQVSPLPGFPLAGLTMSLLLMLASLLFAMLLPPSIQAMALLLLWVVLTGALHIDAVADSFDALLGGVGNSERSLKIMKDPLLGAAGATALTLLLLCKYLLLVEVLTLGWHWVLAPFVARSIVVLQFENTPYVSSQGLATGWREGSAFLHAKLSLLCLFIVLLVSQGVVWTGMAAMLTSLCYLGWRRLWLQRIGGFTGDTAGALIELLELLFLFLLVMS